MKKKPQLLIMVLAMVGLVATAACSDTVPEDTDDTGSAEPTTQVDPTETTQATEPTETTEPGTNDAGSDPAALAARLQSEMTTLSEEIQASEGAEDLQTAWAELETQVSSALADIGDGNINAGDLEDQLDEFQSTLDAMGEDVGSEVREAWATLRSSLEELMG